jgi:hypothetical protein
MAHIVIFPYFIRPIELTVDNDAFYVRKEWYMASEEGIRKTYTCMCQITNGQVVCVEMKLIRTTEGLYQNSATLVLLHEYGLLIHQVRLAHTYPIPPWEMIHLPGGDNAVCM